MVVEVVYRKVFESLGLGYCFLKGKDIFEDLFIFEFFKEIRRRERRKRW